MSDNFYDFDKDDSFDESYLKKNTSSPKKKEFEIEIPAPKSGIKSTMPQKNSQVSRAAAKRKKLSPIAKTFISIGMVLSCILAFALAFAGTVFGWKYLPSFDEKTQEDSVVNDTKQIQEYVEISDDGSNLEVVPLYKETSSQKDSSSQNSGSSQDEKKEQKSEDSSSDSAKESTASDSPDSDGEKTEPEGETIIDLDNNM